MMSFPLARWMFSRRTVPGAQKLGSTSSEDTMVRDMCSSYLNEGLLETLMMVTWSDIYISKITVFMLSFLIYLSF